MHQRQHWRLPLLWVFAVVAKAGGIERHVLVPRPGIDRLLHQLPKHNLAVAGRWLAACFMANVGFPPVTVEARRPSGSDATSRPPTRKGGFLYG